jgi:Zn-dependent protease with chaperone function
MKTPPIHVVLLTDEMNAGVMQLPKFGLIGPKRNYLLIGLPLLLSLSKEQFTAVLGHEFAHISHADTRMSAWIYRIRRTWGTVMAKLEEKKQFGTFLFRKFFLWYYPIFDAHAFVLSRLEEYRADRAAAEVASTKDKSDALLHLGIAGTYFYNGFYDDLLEAYAKEDGFPSPFSHYQQQIRRVPDENRIAYLQHSLERKTDLTDTHPSLSDRLEALEKDPYLPEINETSALLSFFNKPDQILEEFDSEWREQRGEDWESARHEYRSAFQRLQMLESSPLESFDEMWDLAVLTERFISIEVAVPCYEKVIEAYPQYEETGYAYLKLGEIFLYDDFTKAKGISFIQKGMDLNWTCRLDGLELLCNFYYRMGDQEQFEYYLNRMQQWEETLEESDSERDYPSAGDQYAQHDLGEDVINQIRVHLEKFPVIREAYLVRRFLKVIPERKQYLLGIIADSEVNPDEFFEGWILEDAALLDLAHEDELKKQLQLIPGSLL